MRAKKVDSNQKQIVSELRAEGFAVALMHRAGEGFPDLVVSRKGWGTFLVEVKAPKQKPNERQIQFYRDWEAAGGDEIYVIQTSEELLLAIGYRT